jgi:hypothetical protein
MSKKPQWGPFNHESYIEKYSGLIPPVSFFVQVPSEVACAVFFFPAPVNNIIIGYSVNIFWLSLSFMSSHIEKDKVKTTNTSTCIKPGSPAHS